MIQQVAFAASSDEARPVLMGVLVSVDKDKLTMAAADGFRLSVRKAVLSTPALTPVSAIVPAQALKELARVASDGEEPIYMVLPKGRGQVVFRVKDVEVVSQLIDGTFPDYQQIIPRSYKSRTPGFHLLPAEGLQAGRDLCPRRLQRGPLQHQVCPGRVAAQRSGNLCHI